MRITHIDPDAAALGSPPPRRRGRPPNADKTTKPKTPPVTVPLDEIRQFLIVSHVRAGMTIAIYDKNIGTALVEDAETAANEWIARAKTNPATRAKLESLVRGAGGFKLASAYSHTMLAIFLRFRPDLAPQMDALRPFMGMPPATATDETAA